MGHTRNLNIAKHETPSCRKTPPKIKGNALPLPRALILAFFLFWGIPNTHAQRFEITPFLGGRFGGTVDLTQQNNPNADFMKIKSSPNYGVMADVSFTRHWQAEFMWSRQPTSLSVHNPSDGTYSNLSPVNLDTYLFGLTYQFRQPETKLRPYVVLGVGFPHYGVPGINGKHPPAGSFGGGVKYYFTRNFGLRLEARFVSVDTTFKETDLCSYGMYYFPEPCSINNFQSGPGQHRINFPV